MSSFVGRAHNRRAAPSVARVNFPVAPQVPPVSSVDEQQQQTHQQQQDAAFDSGDGGHAGDGDHDAQWQHSGGVQPDTATSEQWEQGTQLRYRAQSRREPTVRSAAANNVSAARHWALLEDPDDWISASMDRISLRQCVHRALAGHIQHW